MNENNQTQNEQEEMTAEARVRALEEREAALDLRERTARCRAELQGRDLPDSLVACLDLSSDQRADAGLEALAAAFNDAVTRRVKAKLGAEPPRAGTGAIDALAAVRKAMGL